MSPRDSSRASRPARHNQQYIVPTGEETMGLKQRGQVLARLDGADEQDVAGAEAKPRQRLGERGIVRG